MIEKTCCSCRLSSDEARALRHRQRTTACEACGARDRLVVDHSHTTGRVRGILCDDCNVTLGKMGDDPDRLLSLAAYLLSDVNLLKVTS